MNIYKILISMLLTLFFAFGSFAQDEADEKHIAAAKKMLEVTKFTDRFDTILPDMSIALKRQLTNDEPEKTVEIDLIVDEEAFLLVARRASLESEALRLLVKTYSIEELNSMAEFFASKVGQKYLEGMPVVFKDLDKAARIWTSGIKRDLTQNVIRRLKEN